MPDHRPTAIAPPAPDDRTRPPALTPTRLGPPPGDERQRQLRDLLGQLLARLQRGHAPRGGRP